MNEILRFPWGIVNVSLALVIIFYLVRIAKTTFEIRGIKREIRAQEVEIDQITAETREIRRRTASKAETYMVVLDFLEWLNDQPAGIKIHVREEIATLAGDPSDNNKVTAAVIQYIGADVTGDL